jgi:hypothetical protein
MCDNGTGSITYNYVSVLSAGFTWPSNIEQYGGDGGQGYRKALIKPIHTVSTPTTYTVLAHTISAAGCTTTVNLPITINPAPANQLQASSTSGCDNGRAAIGYNTGPGSVRFAFPAGVYNDGTMNPASGVTVQFFRFDKVSATTVFNVPVSTILNGCTTTVNFPITVNPAPQVPVITPGNPTICQPQTVSLTASGPSGVTYQWRTGNSPISGATSAVYNTGTAGAYSVIVTNTANSCQATSAVSTVTVLTPPATTITPSGNINLCAGATQLLTASAATSYQWYKDGQPISGATTSTYTASAAGSYTVQESNDPRCTATSAATIIAFYPAPVASITITSGTTSVCTGKPVTFTAPSGTGYRYVWKRDNVATGATGQTFGTTAGGSYTVTVASTVCGTNATSAPVTVTDLPSPRVTTNPDISKCNSVANQALKAGSALKLGGLTSFVAPTPTLINNSAVTIDFWMWVASADLTNTRGLFTLGNQDNPNRCQAVISGNTLNWDYGNSLTSGDRTTAPFVNKADKWTHVALVSQGGTGGNRSIYLDGVLAGSINTSTATSNGPDVNISSVSIGTAQPSGVTAYKGLIDQFRVWNVALTQAQIQANMNEEVAGTTSGLAASWRFDEATGNAIDDKTNLANGNIGAGNTRVLTADALGAANMTTYAWKLANGTVLANTSSYTPPNLAGSTTYTLTATKPDGCVASAQVTITNNACRTTALLGTDSSSADELLAELYPNPASDLIHLKVHNSKSDFVHLEVTDMKGIKIFEDEKVEVQSEYTFGKELPSGVYMIRITDAVHIQIIKLVVTK